MSKPKIVFMGTPEFAVGILDSILKNNYEVVGVITAPDKPAGRGQKVSQSAVKEYAMANGLKVLQPTNLKSQEFITQLQQLNADLQVVVAFRMLPEAVWQLPKLGTFNLHASLLPDYRGAAPINWAIINGETKTGVTTFFIDNKIDTGNIILKKETHIGDTETAGQLHDRLMTIGCEAVIETLNLIENNLVSTTVQPAEETKTAYKLFKENCKINWQKSTNDIYNLIRGLHPYPAAWTTVADNEKQYSVKIFDSEKEICLHNFTTGMIITDNKKNLKIATKDGFIVIKSWQFPGKKRMNIQEFLNGYSFGNNAICV